MLIDTINNQIGADMQNFFLSVFAKKGYTVTGKSVVITPENIAKVVDRTVAGNFYLMANSAVAPSAAAFSPLYYGDLTVRTFVQAFTSGVFIKRHSNAIVNTTGTSQETDVVGKTGIVALEVGDSTDANFMESVFINKMFSDFEQVYGGAAPIGTLRSIMDFNGYKISLV